MLQHVEAIRGEWLHWSVERLQKEASNDLGRPEPVDVKELPAEALIRLVAASEPVDLGSQR